MGEIDPSSASVPVAVQVRVLPTTTPEEGEMAAVEIVGVVFSTVMLAEESVAEPSESVAVAVHVTLEPTSVSEAETVYVLPVPTEKAPTVHA